MNIKVQKRKNELRIKRKRRVRGKISGTTARPRVSVFKSNKHMYAQAIDDVLGHTLAACDGAHLNLRSNVADATKLAQAFAATLNEKNIKSIVFDVNGFKYHGVIKAFGDELRNNGIEF
jgi:large subunit ribosomal protein L18